jgi:hypothetical protein
MIEAVSRGGQRVRAFALGDAHDDVVALQTRLQDLSLATALAVEQCKALTPTAQAQWSSLAQRTLQYVSADPGTLDTVIGQGIGNELAAFSQVLQGAGCQGPVPAPPPRPAPPPPPPAPNQNGGPPEPSPWSAAEKVAVAATVIACVVGAVKLVEVFAPAPASRSSA